MFIINSKEFAMNRGKELIKQHKKAERDARTKRFCTRHGMMEKHMPDLIKLTDREFETFIARAINTTYYKDTEKQYGTRTQLESKKGDLLTEKLRIENATGVTAAREAEQQRKRDAVIQQRQDRDRYNAERKHRTPQSTNSTIL